jgi:hypothetical protein
VRWASTPSIVGSCTLAMAKNLPWRRMLEQRMAHVAMQCPCSTSLLHLFCRSFLQRPRFAHLNRAGLLLTCSCRRAAMGDDSRLMPDATVTAGALPVMCRLVDLLFFFSALLLLLRFAQCSCPCSVAIPVAQKSCSRYLWTNGYCSTASPPRSLSKVMPVCVLRPCTSRAGLRCRLQNDDVARD